MPEASPMLVLLRAISDPDRLRVIGALSRGPASAACLAESLGLPLRQTLHHLDRLADWGLLHSHADVRQHTTVYELDPQAVEDLARKELKRPSLAYVPQGPGGQPARGWNDPAHSFPACQAESHPPIPAPGFRARRGLYREGSQCHSPPFS